MNSRISPYGVIALTGVLLWSITIPLRDMITTDNALIVLTLGVLPNFGVALFIPFLLIAILIDRKTYGKDVLRKVFYWSLLSLMVFLGVAEVWHARYANSPFDIYDLLASFAAMTIGIVGFNALQKRDVGSNSKSRA